MMKMTIAGVDIKTVVDVNDVGDGLPLYVQFGPEDWALMQLRWELHTLATSYKKDVNDEDRTEIPYEHLAFYYGRYFKKGLNPKDYDKENWADLCTMVADTAKVEDGKLSIVVSEDTEADAVFVKLTEEKRRERQRHLDAGDETARLKLGQMVTKVFAPKAAQGKQHQAASKKVA